MIPFPFSPGTRAAYRLLVEEIRDIEIAIAKDRCRIALLKGGAHPQQQLVEALVAWECAMKDTYSTRARATQHKRPEQEGSTDK